MSKKRMIAAVFCVSAFTGIMASEYPDECDREISKSGGNLNREWLRDALGDLKGNPETLARIVLMAANQSVHANECSGGHATIARMRLRDLPKPQAKL